jgi:hypothetical protein
METKRSIILEEMIKLMPLCSGNLYERYTPCGKKNCRCQDKEDPKLHGPYYIWARNVNGKQVTRTFRPGSDLERVKEGIENYRRFQVLYGDLLMNDEASVLSTHRSVSDEGKKNSARRYRKRLKDF